MPTISSHTLQAHCRGLEEPGKLFCREMGMVLWVGNFPDLKIHALSCGLQQQPWQQGGADQRMNFSQQVKPKRIVTMESNW